MTARRGDRWPRAVRVRGERWRVLLVSLERLNPGIGRMTKAQLIKEDFAIGKAEPNGRLLMVWRGLLGHHRWIVLLHEMGHLAMGAAYGWNGVVRSREERIVHALTTHSSAEMYWILNRYFGFGPEG